MFFSTFYPEPKKKKRIPRAIAAAYQAPPSMGFSRKEYWSGLPLPSLEPNLIGDKVMLKRYICCLCPALGWQSMGILFFFFFLHSMERKFWKEGPRHFLFILEF